VLTLERGAFRTWPVHQGLGVRVDTVDAFFESLAEDCGSRAIAVVLADTGADGVAGALCIKRSGGVVIVQEPRIATDVVMPRATLAGVGAHYVLPPRAIALQVARCASPTYCRPSDVKSESDELTPGLRGCIELIHDRAGFDLRGYKPAPLLWRIQRRMGRRGVRSLPDYESLLRDDVAEIEALVREIPLQVTEFFRDPDA
jgi:two-component system CheB/CheR fusion protein